MSLNNIAFGLLSVLFIISASNDFGSFTEGSFSEGFGSIGQNNSQQQVLTRTETIKRELAKQNTSVPELGVDKETIKETIRAKDSNTITVDPNMNKNDEVMAHNSITLSNTSSLTEGFAY